LLGRSGTIPDHLELLLYAKKSAPKHFAPLSEAIWRSAAEADHMRADDAVLGLYLDGKAWALPWWVMKNHHLANLTLAERPLLVTLCEACSAAAAFDPVIDGVRHSFRLVGMHNGTHVMGDDETESIWGSFTGEALYGRRKGHVLERLPLYQCRWGEWCILHPESGVAYAAEEARGGHGAEHELGRPSLGPLRGSTMARPPDPRLASGSMVLGVEIEGSFKAYPLELLPTVDGVVNDRIAGNAVVVISTPGTLMAAAFGRTVDGRLLDLERAPDGRIVDRQHGSHWNQAGEALDGPLAGRTLPYVRSGIEAWFVWAAYHPTTTIFDGAGDD
jgi:hypothetical protein